MRDFKQILLISFEILTCGGLLLLVPCGVAGLPLDSLVADLLVSVVLVAAAGTAVLTAIAIREGWFLKHLSDWHRREPQQARSPRAGKSKGAANRQDGDT